MAEIYNSGHLNSASHSAMAVAMNANHMPQAPSGRARRRTRKDAIELRKAPIAERVIRFAEQDWSEISDARGKQLQRYAKFRMWAEGKDWPWPNASDFATPDLMQLSQRTQDTLFNAVLLQRPPIMAKSTDGKAKDKEEKVAKLIDYQLFAETSGETMISEMASRFCNDTALIVMPKWVQENRHIAETHIYPPLPETMEPEDYFSQIVQQAVPGVEFEPSEDGWSFRLIHRADDGKTQNGYVEFYTMQDESIEAVVCYEIEVFNGPVVQIFDRSSVLFPSRSANLQPPSPRNPNGAPHVTLVDYPTVDEIQRLQRSGYYDLVTPEETDAMASRAEGAPHSETNEQKDAFFGGSPQSAQSDARTHNRLTRYMCFDLCDLDGDGIDEDAVFWVIKETKTLLKAARLTEMVRMSPPRRPLLSSSYFPVEDRVDGLSLLELTEGIHDLQKQLFDQAIDAGTLANVPFFAYRPVSSVKPEAYRIEPGVGLPLQDPKGDINVLSFQNPQGGVMQLNFITLLDQMRDKLSMMSDMNYGQVPAGKATALRTIGGMAMLANQGEARPERILRRFFALLSEIWAMVHELNRRHLSKRKKIRVLGVLEPEDDPYLEIEGPQDIDSEMQFEFSANVLNASKDVLQQTYMGIFQVFVNPMMMQLGIVTPDAIYRWGRGFMKALGQNPDDLKPPSPAAAMPLLFAEEVIMQVMSNLLPSGRPAEPGGWQEHLGKLQAFMQSDDLGHLSEAQTALLWQYIQKAQALIQQEQQQQMMMQAAQQFQQQMGGGAGQPGAPQTQPNPPVQGNPQVSGAGEMLNESMPGAGGGGNAGMAA